MKEKGQNNNNNGNGRKRKLPHSVTGEVMVREEVKLNIFTTSSAVITRSLFLFVHVCLACSRLDCYILLHAPQLYMYRII